MKFTQEYLALQKEKRRAYQKKYHAKYYPNVLKPKRSKKCIQENVLDKPKDSI